LAAEAASLREIGDTEVKQVGLHLARTANRAAVFIADPHVTCGARQLPSAFADDAWHASANCGAHDGLAHRNFDLALVLFTDDIHNFRHLRLLFELMA
jgi:hypothetical protein